LTELQKVGVREYPRSVWKAKKKKTKPFSSQRVEKRKAKMKKDADMFSFLHIAKKIK
jgi:hypothetical protein